MYVLKKKKSLCYRRSTIFTNMLLYLYLMIIEEERERESSASNGEERESLLLSLSVSGNNDLPKLITQHCTTSRNTRDASLGQWMRSDMVCCS